MPKLMPRSSSNSWEMKRRCSMAITERRAFWNGLRLPACRDIGETEVEAWEAPQQVDLVAQEGPAFVDASTSEQTESEVLLALLGHWFGGQDQAGLGPWAEGR